jgi:hypothetical protein
MTFRPGQSGNPAGRPRGSRNRKTLAAAAAAFEHAGDAIAHQDMSPDQEVSLQIVADSAENGGRHPLTVRVDVALRCGAAGKGASLVNNNENTSAALDGDAHARGREAANSLQLFWKIVPRGRVRCSTNSRPAERKQADNKQTTSRNKGPWNFALAPLRSALRRT